MAHADAIFKIYVLGGEALGERHGAEKRPGTLMKQQFTPQEQTDTLSAGNPFDQLIDRVAGLRLRLVGG
jgi:hypothetical protein